MTISQGTFSGNDAASTPVGSSGQLTAGYYWFATSGMLVSGTPAVAVYLAMTSPPNITVPIDMTTYWSSTWTGIVGVGSFLVPLTGAYNLVLACGGSSFSVQVGGLALMRASGSWGAYADGDTSGWVWSGTVGNSVSLQPGARTPQLISAVNAVKPAGVSWSLLQT